MKVESMEALHKAVGERDKWICSECGKDFSYDCYFLPDGRNAYICAHHSVHTQGARPDLRFETDNCVAICKPCHQKIG